MAISFGLFDWIDRRPTPIWQLYEERLALLEAADAAGFYCYHIAEHHATPLGMAPSPSVFLAAAAQRTRRIHFGPLVYLLPLYSPLRLIAEICMLDHLSGGRLEVGVGRGVSPYEVGYHGLAVEHTRAMFLEALSVLVAGMTNNRLTHKGEYYQYEDVPMELTPLQKPYPPIWYATNTIDNVEWASARGMSLVSLGPAPAFRAMVDRHRAAWRQHEDDPGRLNPHISTPRLGITRLVVVANTDREAEDMVRAAHPRWKASFVKLWDDHDDASIFQRISLLDLETSLRDEMIVSGSPERVRAQVSRLMAASSANYFVGCFAWGDLTLDQSLKSLRLFADEVIPAFRN